MYAHLQPSVIPKRCAMLHWFQYIYEYGYVEVRIDDGDGEICTEMHGQNPHILHYLCRFRFDSTPPLLRSVSYWCILYTSIPFHELFANLLSFSCKLGEEVEAKVAEPTAA